MLLGTLHRYVIRQVVRAFLLALAALTTVIVLFMVMAEASRQGFGPQVVIRAIPFMVCATLPYTAPVALLFAVTMVYGRLAGDNEVIAVKAAGCSIWTVLNPTVLFAGALSVILWVFSGEIIPRSAYAFKTALFQDAEEQFFLFLKREREFNNPSLPVFIGVKDVIPEKRILIGPTFKFRARDAANPNVFQATVQAESAVIRFDTERRLIRAELTRAVLQGAGRSGSTPFYVLEYPMPERMNNLGPSKMVQEMTSGELLRERGQIQYLLRTERTRQALRAGLAIAAGHLEQVNWLDMGDAYRNDAHWKRKVNSLETEQHLRLALAVGPLCFALLGSPVGILFARRDFLSAFFTCFVPIILLYYPLVLAGINMGKEGIVGPWIVWSGDSLLFLLASRVVRRVTRH